MSNMPAVQLGNSAARSPALQTRTDTKRRKGDVNLSRRGVYTAPPQSGGFGYNNTTLSQLKGCKGVVRHCPPWLLSDLAALPPACRHNCF